MYLVMEHITGIPINHYCHLEHLTLKERLPLFVIVCQALQSAHQHLIIHCDIKPENIRVTKEGIPKLVDFGIASLMSQEADAHWQENKNAITYNYASPEAISNKPARLESDVFSLGILLYELITDNHPEHITSNVLSEIKQARSKGLPSPLIAAIQRNLNCSHSAIQEKQLQWVVEKATHLDPKLRYQTVNEIKDDVLRFINHYPVHAKQPTFLLKAYYWTCRQALLALTLISIAAIAVFWITTK